MLVFRFSYCFFLLYVFSYVFMLVLFLLLCICRSFLFCCCVVLFFFFKQKTAYEMRISDWSSDVCSSDLGDWTDGTMTDFKWRHFQGDVILWAVRWYCRFPISYRDLEEMLAERGISVDHTTIYRWVQCYAPEMEKRLRWFWRRGFDPSWRLDETYVKVRGK